MDWLSKGSRELFGTVIENNICILIDTSQSMHLSLDFVKRKLKSLIQVSIKYFFWQFSFKKCALNV